MTGPSICSCHKIVLILTSGGRKGGGGRGSSIVLLTLIFFSKRLKHKELAYWFLLKTKAAQV